eukprot:4243530-Amphidinium_carterae.1
MFEEITSESITTVIIFGRIVSLSAYACGTHTHPGPAAFNSRRGALSAQRAGGRAVRCPAPLPTELGGRLTTKGRNWTPFPLQQGHQRSQPTSTHLRR